VIQIQSRHITIPSYSEDHSEFLAELRQAVRNSPLTQKQIAEQANVNPATIGHWTDGSVTRPRIDTLWRVLRVLGYRIIITKGAAYV
jgi:transcriptional regulator with XRE-family HTH domain